MARKALASGSALDTRLDAVLRRLHVRTSAATEWGWAIGRFGVLGALSIGAALFMRDSSASFLIFFLIGLVLAYNLLLLLLLRRRLVAGAFTVGIVLDSAATMGGWLGVVRLTAQSTPPNDMYLALFPILIIGAARLGLRLGTLYTALWLGWVGWITAFYYPSGSYPLEQLPLRLLFLALAAALTILLVGRLHRERDRAEELLGKTREGEAKIRKLNAELEARVTERTAELTAATRELEAFSRSASHDLRNQLWVVDGFTQVLLERPADDLDTEARNYLRRIRSASERMGRTIDDILHLREVTKADLRKEPVDLTALARSVAHDLAASHPQRQVAVHVAEGLAAEGDPKLLRTVLENLLGNAWKFTASRTDAFIEVGAIPFNGGQAYFVQDNGVGFDDTDSGKLFTPFQRLHPQDRFPGTGIGLATVSRVIQRHGGRVWAKGSPGQGATFFFTLPSAEAIPAPSLSEPAVPAAGA